MTVKSVTFEGQSNGTTWSVANSGGGSGDAINTLTGGATQTFSTSWSASGTRSLWINATANQGISVFTINTNTFKHSEDIYFNNVPTVAQDIMSLSGGPKLQLAVTTGALKVLNQPGTLLYTFTTLFSASTHYRIATYIANTGSTATGTIKVALFVGHSDTPVEEYIGTNVNAGTGNYTAFNWGKLTGGSVVLNMHIDNVRYDDAPSNTNYLSPSVYTLSGVPAMVSASRTAVSLSSGVSMTAVPATVQTTVLSGVLSSGVTLTITTSSGEVSAPSPSLGITSAALAVAPGGIWATAPPASITVPVTLTATPSHVAIAASPVSLTAPVALGIAPASGTARGLPVGLTVPVSLSTRPAGVEIGMQEPAVSFSTNLAVILTRGRMRQDIPISPPGEVRVILTRALMNAGTKLAVILTRAQAWAAGSLPVLVAIGQNKTVPPFKEMEIVATVPTVGLDAESWTWSISSSNPRGPVIPVISTTDIENDTLTYRAPATVTGTVLTISATAHIDGRTDTTKTVTHTVTPHLWPWHIGTDNKYYPTHHVPVEIEE